MKYLFGPVPSRRLGLSLGIDIIPFKTCTLDCIYCECGPTTHKTLERRSFVKKDDLIREIKFFLSQKPALDYITFSGSGEPLLNLDISWFIEKIKEMTSVPVAILTNGTLLISDKVAESVMRSDLVIPSLDAATQAVFEKVNKPCKGLKINKIISALAKFKKKFTGRLWLEILFVKDINDSQREIEKLKKAVERIRPDRVQLNTIDRPPADKKARALPFNELKQVKQFLSQTGIPVDIIVRKGGVVYQKASAPLKLKSQILGILKRRPETAAGLSKALGIRIVQINKILRAMEESFLILPEQVNKDIFYKIKKI
ncbi:MAG: radical SAM protein [Spirochaetes bacterium]|nr:radical SAM protein [Spirochaetota bacterium]